MHRFAVTELIIPAHQRRCSATVPDSGASRDSSTTRGEALLGWNWQAEQMVDLLYEETVYESNTRQLE